MIAPNFNKPCSRSFCTIFLMTSLGIILKKGQTNCPFFWSGRNPMALFHINPPQQTVGCHYIKDAIQNNETKTIPLLLVRKSKNLRIGSYYFLGSSTARQVLFLTLSIWDIPIRLAGTHTDANVIYWTSRQTPKHPNPLQQSTTTLQMSILKLKR